MRDLVATWTEVPDWATARLAAPGLEIRGVAGLEQLLVSGDLVAALRDLAEGAKPVGFHEVASGDPFAIRLARDRALIVSTREITASAGWREGGYAATPVSGGYHVFDVSGPGIADLLGRATTLDPGAASPSATVGFAGIAAVVYRHESEDRLRVHVERGLAPYLWQWLRVNSSA
jgi:sarcosine oxidase gamma subunit